MTAPLSVVRSRRVVVDGAIRPAAIHLRGTRVAERGRAIAGELGVLP